MGEEDGKRAKCRGVDGGKENIPTSVQSVVVTCMNGGSGDDCTSCLCTKVPGPGLIEHTYTVHRVTQQTDRTGGWPVKDLMNYEWWTRYYLQVRDTQEF